VVCTQNDRSRLAASQIYTALPVVQTARPPVRCRDVPTEPPTQFFLTPTPMAHVHIHASHATDLCCCIPLATDAPNQPTTVAGRAPGTRAGWRTGAGDVQTVRSRLQRSAERRRHQGKKKKWSVRQGAQHPTSPAAHTPIRLPSLKAASSTAVDRTHRENDGRFGLCRQSAARYCKPMLANAIWILDNDSSNGVDTQLCAPVLVWEAARLTVCPSFACS
jgi:hypothetical protein